MDRQSPKVELAIAVVLIAIVAAVWFKFGRATTLDAGITCQICDNPTFVACNASTAGSPRCSGAKGNELRVFCGQPTPYLIVPCATPKLKYGVDAHGLPDHAANILTCK